MDNHQIYYAEGRERRGPFTLSQLSRMNLSPYTLVWYQGLSDWTPAAEAPLTAGIFETRETHVPETSYSTPRPYSSAGTQYGNRQASHEPLPPCPDTYMVWAILATLFCCLPFGIVSIVYASKVSSLYYMGNYEASLDASHKARTWAMWSAISALIILAIYALAGAMIGTAFL